MFKFNNVGLRYKMSNCYYLIDQLLCQIMHFDYFSSKVGIYLCFQEKSLFVHAPLCLD